MSVEPVHPLSGSFSPAGAAAWAGARFPPGAHVDGHAVTFAVYSRHATRVLLEFYEHPLGEPRRFEFQDVTLVRFRTLDNATIERYLHAEQPYDCAGSFKAEGLGICLFEAIESLDPTALVGLPLIGLANALRGIGYRLP